MGELSKVISENSLKIRLVESSIQKAVLESLPADQIAAHVSDRNEMLIKQKLYFQLQGKIRTADNYSNIKPLTIKALENISLHEALNQTRPNYNYIRSITSLKQALIKLHEPGESIIGFIKTYLNVSSFNKPITLSQFRNMRSYTNNNSFESIRGINPENAGDDIDNELKLIDSIDHKIEMSKQAAKNKPWQSSNSRH